MSEAVGIFEGVAIVSPALKELLKSRPVGHFEMTSKNATQLRISSVHADAESLFKSKTFEDELSALAWELVWEQLVAVRFELMENTMRTVIDAGGREDIHFSVGDTILTNPENRGAGLQEFKNFDLLQLIRNHLITKYLIPLNQANAAKIKGNAAVLLAMEHFIKGVMIRRYAMAEFYSVVETIENQLGGRHHLNNIMTKAKVNKIVQFANMDQLDQRHPPKDPTTIKPLPPNTIEDAAVVAKEIITEFVKGIT